MDIAQFRAGLDAELIDQHPACLLISMQRLSSPPGAGQREHELGVEPFLQRMPGRHLQQVRYQFLVLPEPEPGIDAVLEHLKPQPLKAGHKLPAQRLRGYVQQRGCPPQPQCPRGSGGCVRPLAGPQRCPGVAAQRLELQDVQLRRLHAD